MPQKLTRRNILSCALVLAIRDICGPIEGRCCKCENVCTRDKRTSCRTSAYMWYIDKATKDIKKQWRRLK